MSKPVPMRAALCVQAVQIVVANVLVESLNLQVEGLATKGWISGILEGQTIAGGEFSNAEEKATIGTARAGTSGVLTSAR
ncbi:hypothetical protein RRF57_013184 [Xylaria bambusicola]|uniref:Uncharacterized protein n=1 Tax=Xylaria bambusicola TaxID=326684 RepID=A0AAN7V512_9PEZI